jgi:hypothetical protein
MTFAINALTTNVGSVKNNAIEKVISWTKPIISSYMLNIDASYHSDG